MKNTSSSDWSHLTLDVYPSGDADDVFTLYEDDAETVAYKAGEYRETDISLRGDGAKQTLKIAKAGGSFSGARAFTTRSYTVRIHQPDFAGSLQSVTVNGRSVTFERVASDPAADPLSIAGGARDADVYTFTFSADVYAETAVEAVFSD
jgi:hypothetical protein